MSSYLPAYCSVISAKVRCTLSRAEVSQTGRLAITAGRARVVRICYRPILKMDARANTAVLDNYGDFPWQYELRIVPGENHQDEINTSSARMPQSLTL